MGDPIMTLPFLNAGQSGKAGKAGKAGKKIKAYRGETVAERVLWMSRTSDVLGSFTNTNLDGYTTLIRRKVQERCGTTQELMSTIRRLKSGDTGHVTPNEFRLTMLKFGISLPLELIKHIFDLFDTDRSGTIDFDEFAMWIMNSEFRPVAKNTVAKTENSYEEEVKRKLSESMKLYPRAFASLKAKFTFLEIVSEITRHNMPVTERDARYVFQVLDEEETGVVDMKKLKRWVYDGLKDTPPGTAKPFEAPDLKVAIYRICGKNAHLLQKCFSYIPRNQGVKVQFDEFKRSLLSVDLGRNQKDSMNLFLALGGQSGYANIDLLLDNLEILPINPKTEASIKKELPAKVPFARADRLLRDAMRKSYKQVQSTIEMVDTTGSGFIDPVILHKILNNICCPLSFQDFRLATQRVQTNDAGFINWAHFMKLYNPNMYSHVLDGRPIVDVPSDNKSLDETFNTAAAERNITKSLSVTDLDHLSMSSTVNPAATEVKRIWRAALKFCVAEDPERTGFVNKLTFLNSLRDHVGKSLTTEEIVDLTNKYSHDEDVDYHSCFKHCLNEALNKVALSSNQSVFTLAPVNKARPLASTHPWEFNYVKNQQESDPYWTRACKAPRPMTQPVSLDSATRNSFAKSLSTSQLKTYDAKVIAIAKKVSNHQNFRDLQVELKRAQINNHKGCITTNNLQAILSHLDINLSKHEMGTLLRVFRTIGLNDVFSFRDFLDLCFSSRLAE